MKLPSNIHVIGTRAKSYLIEREDYAILIDTGRAKNAKKIIQKIKAFCHNKTLKTVFITHAHHDHIGGLESIGQLYGPKIICHKKEKRYLLNPAAFKKQGLKGFSLYLFHKFKKIGYTVDQVVTDYDVVDEMKIFHVPGHTEGTIAIEDTQSHALFVGDSISVNQKGTKIKPPSRLFSFDYKTAIASSARLLKHATPKYILPGHGSVLYTPKQAIKTYLEKYD